MRTDEHGNSYSCQVFPFMLTGYDFTGRELGLGDVCPWVDVNALYCGVEAPREGEDVAKNWASCVDNGPRALLDLPLIRAKAGGGKAKGKGSDGGGEAKGKGAGGGARPYTHGYRYQGRQEEASSHVHKLVTRGANSVLPGRLSIYCGSQYKPAGVSGGNEKSRASLLWHHKDMAVDDQDQLYPLCSQSRRVLPVEVCDQDRVGSAGDREPQYRAYRVGFHSERVVVRGSVRGGRVIQASLRPKRFVLPGAAVSPSPVHVACT